jgi:hypothetical protein
LEVILDVLKEEFKKLALGTRFSYERFSKEWVKIGATTIAEWDESLKTAGWLGQSICSFDENDDTTKIVYVL